jgi:hypothetical protein
MDFLQDEGLRKEGEVGKEGKVRILARRLILVGSDRFSPSPYPLPNTRNVLGRGSQLWEPRPRAAPPGTALLPPWAIV